jgi:ketosteroid isomerase-like protein
VSEENIELQRRVVDAFNARDIDGFIVYADPGIELHSAFAAVGGAVYRGHDGLRDWHRDFEEAWGTDVGVRVEAYFDLGDDVMAYYVLHGRGKASGVEVDMPNALVARWRDGLMVYFKVYAHREDVLVALDVVESELEPIAP